MEVHTHIRRKLDITPTPPCPSIIFKIIPTSIIKINHDAVLTSIQYSFFSHQSYEYFNTKLVHAKKI